MNSNTYHQVHDLNTVMAYAVMAQDINGDYVKGNYHTQDSRVYSNRDIILHSMNLRNLPTDETRTFMFENIPDEDQTQRAKDIITYYTGLMIKALGTKINDFESKVLSFVKNGEVATYDFGMIASLPKSHARATERDRVESQQRALSENSDFVGVVGDTVLFDIEILRKNYINKLGCDVVNAVDRDKNLIVFFTGKGEEFENVSHCKIKARVKRHQISNQHGGKETVFNYVKVVDKS